jgi:hypothetical protein
LTAAGASHGDGDWALFAVGARRFDLHVYAKISDLVIGPFALALTRGVVAAGGYWTAVVLAVALGIVAIGIAEFAAHRWCPNRDVRLVVLVGGCILMGPWTTLALFGHLEDALVLTFGVAATTAVMFRRPLVVGTCLGLAVASKPWAVILVPILLALEHRDRLRAFVVAMVIAAVAWVPFLIAEPSATTSNNVFIAPDSIWHVVGASDLAPSWMRIVELTLAFVLTALVARRRLPAVLVVAVSWRVALDPATWSYYWAGVVLGALVLDILGARRPIPWWTVAAFLVVASADELGLGDSGQAPLRVGFALAVLAAGLAPKQPVDVNAETSTRPHVPRTFPQAQ